MGAAAAAAAMGSGGMLALAATAVADGAPTGGDRVVWRDARTGLETELDAADVVAVSFGRVQLRWGDRFENVPVARVVSIDFAAGAPGEARGRWRAWTAVREAAARSPRAAALPLARLIDASGDAAWAAAFDAEAGVRIGAGSKEAGPPRPADARAIRRLIDAGGHLQDAAAQGSGSAGRVRRSLERLADWAAGHGDDWSSGAGPGASVESGHGAGLPAGAHNNAGPDAAPPAPGLDPARAATAWLRVGLARPRGRAAAEALIAAAELYAGPLGDAAAADRILVRGLQMRAGRPDGDESKRLAAARERLRASESAGRALLRPEFDTARPEPR